MKSFTMPQLSKRFLIVLAVLLLVGGIGVGAYGYQFVKGLGVTGLNNGASWGFYIAMFLFCEGMASGAMVMATSGYVFHQDKLKPMALPCAVLSFIFMGLAGLYVTLDMGMPLHALYLMISLNIVSPLAWDILSLTSFLVIAGIFIYTLLKRKADSKLGIAAAHGAFIFAIAVPTVAAFIFALQAGRHGWHSALMGPLFIASGLDSGLALSILALMGLNATKIYSFPEKMYSFLAGILAMFVIVDAFMIFCELVVMSYPAVPTDAHLLHEMTKGSMAPYFWTEMILGLAIPLVLLVFSKFRANKGIVAFASFAVIVGVFCKRMWLVLTSFLYPNVTGAPGLINGSAELGTGMDVWSVVSVYAVSPVEIAVGAGFIALGLAAYLLFAKLVFPRFSTDN